MILTKPQTTAHWYHADGRPQHTVIGITTGKERPTTIKDARRLGLFPSVTTIIGIVAKPGLEVWKVEQGILAALTLPRLAGETDDAFAQRVSADMKAQVVKAGDFGTRLHAAIEDANLGQLATTDTVVEPFLAHYIEWKNANILKVIRAEDRLVNAQLGYAGTFDLLAGHQEHGVCLIDFKTQNVKDGKPKFYDAWAWQLAAYRAALGISCHCLSVVIDSNTPSAPVEKLWTEEELIDGLEIFHHATRIWQVVNKYTPRSE